MVLVPLGDSTGQGWTQVGDLALALVLSAAIGLEREFRHKSAGLRTHSLVGFAAALIMLVSKYGFGDVLSGHVMLDPSRVAAQIVSGIGFLGAGLIFVRRDAVQGLTTAAVVWLTAAVGMAAGAGLWLLAVLATAGHFLVVSGLTPLAARLPLSRYAPSQLRLGYLDGHGVLRKALQMCADHDFVVGDMVVEQPAEGRDPRTVSVRFSVRGKGSVSGLTAELAEIDGMLRVSSGEGDGDARRS